MNEIIIQFICRKNKLNDTKFIPKNIYFFTNVRRFVLFFLHR